MQHHLVHSRLMDWSEDCMTALQFALEAYLKPENDIAIQERRRQLSPVVWVLEPHALNRLVFQKLLEWDGMNYPYITRALKGLLQKKDAVKLLAQKLGDELTRKSGSDCKYTYVENISNPNIGSVVCLSAILELLREKGVRLQEAVIRREINPLFYILSRFYNDGLVVEGCKLPPLAIVHPYHSGRIRAQSGVFTVFAHSEMTQMEYNWYCLSGKSVDPRAMENNSDAATCLHKIRLLQPARIANELFVAGGRDSRLYPELEYFAKDIEASRYYF